jgi:hypothetical protein
VLDLTLSRALHCTALDWTGLDWTGLDWTGLDWTALRCAALRCTAGDSFHRVKQVEQSEAIKAQALSTIEWEALLVSKRPLEGRFPLSLFQHDLLGGKNHGDLHR